MEIKDLKDFYIDLDGDIKTTSQVGTTTAKFITETDKLDSQYLLADNVAEIREAILRINPNFNAELSMFKQFALKTDKDGNVKAVKIYTDYNENEDGLRYILRGIEYAADSVYKEYYFIANDVNSVKNFIERNKLTYEIQNYSTHTPFLYSIKYKILNPEVDEHNAQVNNFKTYYIRNEVAKYYTGEMAQFVKQSLRFI